MALVRMVSYSVTLYTFIQKPKSTVYKPNIVDIHQSTAEI